MSNPQDLVTDPRITEIIKQKADRLCRRSGFSRSDHADIAQAMSQLLIQKLHLFDSARGRLEAFATRVLDSWVGMHLRYRARDKRSIDYSAISLEGTLIDCGGERRPLTDLIGGADLFRRLGVEPSTDGHSSELAEALNLLWERLTARERMVLCHVLRQGAEGAAKRISLRRKRPVTPEWVIGVMTLIREKARKLGLGDE